MGMGWGYFPCWHGWDMGVSISWGIQNGSLISWKIPWKYGWFGGIPVSGNHQMMRSPVSDLHSRMFCKRRACYRTRWWSSLGWVAEGFMTWKWWLSIARLKTIEIEDKQDDLTAWILEVEVVYFTAWMSLAFLCRGGCKAQRMSCEVPPLAIPPVLLQGVIFPWQIDFHKKYLTRLMIDCIIIGAVSTLPQVLVVTAYIGHHRQWRCHPRVQTQWSFQLSPEAPRTFTCSISVCPRKVIMWSQCYPCQFPSEDENLIHWNHWIHPARGGKCSIWEGGTRGTALIYAPSFLPAGAAVPQLDAPFLLVKVHVLSHSPIISPLYLPHIPIISSSCPHHIILMFLAFMGLIHPENPYVPRCLMVNADHPHIHPPF